MSRERMRELPSADFLHECFELQGNALFWKERPLSHFADARAHKRHKSLHAGQKAGSEKRPKVRTPYRTIMIGSVHYFEHRLVAKMFGIPTDQSIDHIDGDTFNNHPSNLRSCSHAENMRNHKGWKNKAERLGVYKSYGGKFIAHICSHGKRHHLGTFDTAEAAAQARAAAEIRLNGAFASTLGALGT